MNIDKMHYVAVTGIIRRNGKYLICKRSSKEKAFPNKWCVPGGKVERLDFINIPKDTSSHWLDILEKVLRKEIMEEANIEIRNIGYVSSLVFIRPNGCSTIIISLHGEYSAGDVKLAKDELVEHAWVTLDEARRFDLIENIYAQIAEVEKLHSAEP
jgi:8-oxo-dGTP pyrophosphatase MutT (NUDIX family)